MDKYNINILIIIATCIYLTNSAGNYAFPSPGSGNCIRSPSTYQCPSFCTFNALSNTLSMGCSSPLAAGDTISSAKCTSCDGLLFIQQGNKCVPHLLNN